MDLRRIPGEWSKVWVPGIRLSIMEASGEAVWARREPLQRAGIADEEGVRGSSGLGLGKWAGRAFSDTSGMLGATGRVGGGDGEFLCRETS